MTNEERNEAILTKLKNEIEPEFKSLVLNATFFSNSKEMAKARALMKEAIQAVEAGVEKYRNELKKDGPIAFYTNKELDD